MNNYYFIDGKIYTNDEVPEELVRRQYFSPTLFEDLFKVKVTGISIINDNTYFFLPKNTAGILSDYSNKKLGKITFESILKYRSENRLKSEEVYWLGKKDSNAELVDTIKWLINDYKNNGIYVEEIAYKSNEINNRIQWSKTIKSQVPLIIDNQIFYPNLISENPKVNTNSLLSAIHDKIMVEITNQYGWLFRVDARKKIININLSDQQIVQFLKNELKLATHTRTQLLIINIIDYLTKNKFNNKTFDLVTPYFEYVWEDALKVIFEDNKSLHDLVGKPYWKFDDGTVRTTNQLPDVLASLDTTLLILDAKYYSMDEDFNGNMPGWESVVKQLYYNLSMKIEYDDIQNIFLMPNFSVNNELYNYIGLTSVDNYEDDFGIVYAFKLNTEFVLTSYLEETLRLHLLSDLLNEVRDKEKTEN